MNDDYICTTTKGKFIRPKTLGQKKYIDLMRGKMIVLELDLLERGKRI